MTHFAQTRSIELRILGEKSNDWREGLLHAAKWARDIQHARKAFPSLDKDTLFVTQCTAPGALGTLNSLIRGRGATEVAEEYPPTLDLKSGTAAAVAARASFHDSWFKLLLESCSVSEQIQIVRAIEELPFPTPPAGENYTMREVAPYTAALQALFQPLPADLRETLTKNQETRDAVYRKLPISIRNLIKNLREHSNEDFEDTWLTICDRLAECALLAEKAERVVTAFMGPKRSYEQHNSDKPPPKRSKFDGEKTINGKTFTGWYAGEIQKEKKVWGNPEKRDPEKSRVLETIRCVQCKRRFDFTKGQADFFFEKGLSRPVRCEECRKLYKMGNPYSAQYEENLRIHKEKVAKGLIPE